MNHYRSTYYGQILFLIVWFYGATSHAQDQSFIKQDLLVKVGFQTESAWFFNLEAKNRVNTNLNPNGSSDFWYLQLDAESYYHFNDQQNFSLVLRYRGKRIYDSQATDEKRIIEQYEQLYPLGATEFKWYFRFEQRFHDRFTWRNRLKFEWSWPLLGSPNRLQELYVKPSLETLWTLANHQNPSFDNRIKMAIIKPISKIFSIELDAEYRYKDFTNHPHDELRFILAVIAAF